MPKPLEDYTFRRIEWCLRHMKELEASATSMRRDVLAQSSAGRLDGMPRSPSKQSSPTERKALAIADCKPERWLDAIRATLAYYDADTMEGQTARLYYLGGQTVKAVAERLDCTERTIHYYRDDFVFRCALFAAERGLIDLSGGERHDAETHFDYLHLR